MLDLYVKHGRDMWLFDQIPQSNVISWVALHSMRDVYKMDLFKANQMHFGKCKTKFYKILPA